MNVVAAVRLIHLLVPAMKQRGWGRIISMSSSTFGSVVTGFVPYVSSKAGIVGFTRAMASELGAFGITVNAIQPGLIRTAMTETMRPDIWEQKMAEIPLGRAGEPAEIASAAAFLASDMSSYITAAVLEVTGGRYA